MQRGSLARLGLLAALFALSFGVGCAKPLPPRLPPVTQVPTGEVSPGKFVWVDLLTEDVEASRSFYGALFGWSFEEGDGYVSVLRDGTPIAGMLKREGRARWIENLSVPDVDAAVATVRAGGGTVERDPVDAPERGRLALVSDPGGARVLLVRTTTGDPPDGDPPLGHWLWRELWTHDPVAASAFYAELVGYTEETVEHAGAPYRVLKQGDVPRAGIVHAPEEVPPQWLPYVRVEDAGRVADLALSLGARVFNRDPDSAILVDPHGAAIGVQSWDGPREEE